MPGGGKTERETDDKISKNYSHGSIRFPIVINIHGIAHTHTHTHTPLFLFKTPN